MENLITIISIAVGLAMDAFAAAICLGLNLKSSKAREKVVAIILTPLFFGVFQGIMPLIGYFSARTFSYKIIDYAPYISFALLMFIGCKMIFDAVRSKGDSEESCSGFSIKELFLLAVATSIDSLAVGISFAFSSEKIIFDVIIITAVTFAISFVGIFVVSRFAEKIKVCPEVIGGAILIIIAFKVLFI